jgi:hypothetical protein
VDARRTGEVEDIVSFVSPLYLMKLRERGLVEAAED